LAELNEVAADLIRADRAGLSVEAIKRSFLENLLYIQGRFPRRATTNDLYMALAHTVRDRLLDRWLSTVQNYSAKDVRIVGYLSAEYLTGKNLENNLIKLGITPQTTQAMQELGVDIQELIRQEEEPGLGNGGLGRLAACYMDSLATLDTPAIGYGIRYEFGIFDQEIRDGWQVEVTDKWLKFGNPWEIPRPEDAVSVGFAGYTEQYTDEHGGFRVRWVPGYRVQGTPYDTPVLGYRTSTVSNLRLWSAEAAESFDFATFNTGDFFGAVRNKVASETISKILYPNDEKEAGKELRLEQQYFFVSCSLQHVLRMLERQHHPLEQLHKKFALQMNDTHPSIGVAELMRLLVDERGVDWDTAWHVTQNTFGYTNHTLLPEALERWPLGLFGHLLPRHLEIIYEINRRHLEDVRHRFPGANARVARLSLIDESGERYVRMAHLATLGSHAVNGVAELHSELLKNELLHDFYEMTPEKFTNVTNGVTQRRWMLLSNPRLSELITARIGDDWITDLDQLRRLENFVEDPGFRNDWRKSKQEAKRQLAGLILQRTGIKLDSNSMFDVMVKRIHEYKRQHLQVLHIIALYQLVKKNPAAFVTPRTFVFGGKAAPGYYMAKLIIKLIHSVGDVVNTDTDVRDRLKVVFVPDYNVTCGQVIYPAADVSEQISLAGKEASGTGNMKFAMNGALTVGTLDGANVEIRKEVGEDNFFLFGNTVEQVEHLWSSGYHPGEYYDRDGTLREVIDALTSGQFSKGDPGLFRPLVNSLLNRDEYMLFADFRSFLDAQNRVSQFYLDEEAWTRKSILNTARMGKFSSDRAIREYSANIWHTQPIKTEF
jgi:glycogen phosphorylase